MNIFINAINQIGGAQGYLFPPLNQISPLNFTWPLKLTAASDKRSGIKSQNGEANKAPKTKKKIHLNEHCSVTYFAH